MWKMLLIVMFCIENMTAINTKLAGRFVKFALRSYTTASYSTTVKEEQLFNNDKSRISSMNCEIAFHRFSPKRFSASLSILIFEEMSPFVTL